ncbi:MAG: hypothetical protein J5752_00290 [Clostridiales bacterium]|nr:hypothetical protein [Clostridiales bacterium]
MTDIRTCPFCAKEMEYDVFSERFVCKECGKSESASENAAGSAPAPKTSPIDISDNIPSRYTAKEPDELLRIYAQDLEAESVEAALVRAEDLLSEEYFSKLSLHPSISALKERLPRCRIPGNIDAYCNKVRDLLNAEEELIKAQDEMKKAEDYVKGSIENEKKKPKIKNVIDPHHTVAYLLLLPLLLCIPAFIGGKHGEKPMVQNINDLKAFFITMGIIYACILLILGIGRIKTWIRNRRPNVGGDILEIKKTAVDEIYTWMNKLQEEKEQILKEIRDEENSIMEKNSRKKD